MQTQPATANAQFPCLLRVQRGGRPSLITALGLSLMLTLSGCKKEEEKALPPAPKATQPKPQKTAQPSAGDELKRRVKQLRKSKGAIYRAPEDQELSNFQNWLTHHTAAAEAGHLPSQPAPKALEATFTDEGRVWLLGEQEDQRRGAGIYALHASTTNNLVIEIPHSFFDAGTLDIGLTAFEQLGARALLINSTHRGGTGNKEERAALARSGKSDFDVAHTPNSFFNTAHTALSEQFPKAAFVQLHGFQDDKVPGAQVIVSAAGTTAKTRPLARAIDDALSPGAAKLYPEEVKQLGGTTNRQARFSKRAGHHFLHIEISSSLRTKLVRDRTLRERFAQAIGQGLSN